VQIAPWPGAADELPRGDPAQGEKASILIVDDLPEKLLVFQTVLEELGQNLVKVRSGAAALREVLKREFAVILLDVNMPDIDGFETAALIRKHPRSMMTPIIFITAYADEVQTAKGYSLGAVDYILSPVDPDILRSKVGVFVSLYLMSRQIRRQADDRAAMLAAEAARRVAEENDRRSAFLAKASLEMSGSLDVEVAMRQCAELLVPEIAPLAVVHLADPDFGAVGTCIAAQQGAAGVQTRWEHGDELGPPLRRLLDRASLARQRIVDGGMLDALASAGAPAPLHSAMAVPLVVGERVLGAILVTAASAEHWRTPAALLLDEVAARAATAFENVRLYRVLQREVRERMAAQEELQAADRRKDEFLAMMSHELRNPLSSIKLAVEVVRRYAAPHPKVDWGIGVADRQLEHLVRMIEELLDVTRISRGKIVLRREPVDLNAVLLQSVDTVHGLIETRRQSLQMATPSEPAWVHGDAARLTQVFSNLLHNASKYSPEASAIRLEALAEEGSVLVTVVDEGIGIDDELLPRVFDMFAQGQRGLDRSQGGLGVGLTLARLLTELHGGRIEVASEGRDKGSRFAVRLPALGPGEVPDAQASSPAAVPQAGAPGSCSVLVVDDNVDAAESLAALLQIEGHRVHVAQDGEQALEDLVRFEPDIVILDIGLPRLDGYEVARRMRRMPQGEALLLMALTGYGQQGDRLQAREAGFDMHFVKPAETGQLLQAIAQWSAGRTPVAG